jgi:hypothetical protein
MMEGEENFVFKNMMSQELKLLFLFKTDEFGDQVKLEIEGEHYIVSEERAVKPSECLLYNGKLFTDIFIPSFEKLLPVHEEIIFRQISPNLLELSAGWSKMIIGPLTSTLLDRLLSVCVQTNCLEPSWDSHQIPQPNFNFSLAWPPHGVFITMVEKNDSLKVEMCQSFNEESTEWSFLVCVEEPFRFFPTLGFFEKLLPSARDIQYLKVNKSKPNNFGYYDYTNESWEICCFRAVIHFRLVKDYWFCRSAYISQDNQLKSKYFSFDIQSDSDFKCYDLTDKYYPTIDQTWTTLLLPQQSITLKDAPSTFILSLSEVRNDYEVCIDDLNSSWQNG